jgi:hypothetical protein
MNGDRMLRKLAGELMPVSEGALDPSGFSVWEVRQVGDPRFVEVVYVRARYRDMRPRYDKLLVIVSAEDAPRIGDRARIEVTRED